MPTMGFTGPVVPDIVVFSFDIPLETHGEYDSDVADAVAAVKAAVVIIKSCGVESNLCLESLENFDKLRLFCHVAT